MNEVGAPVMLSPVLELTPEYLAGFEAAKKLAMEMCDSYPDWTYWGQNKNMVAATMASKEIKEAIRLERPLSTIEINEIL